MEIRKSYIYLISFYDGSFYYGVRLCPKGKTPWQDSGYVGSPVTHKDKWGTTKFIKFILEVFDSYEEAQKKEKELIKSNLNNPRCLNENVGGLFSFEVCSRGGRKAVESGHLASIQSMGGKIQGRKNVESGQLASIQNMGGKVGGKIGGRKTSSQRWKCLVTGFISAPGPLSVYQKKRGIDTSLREKVN